jgi:hypothetical protein
MPVRLPLIAILLLLPALALAQVSSAPLVGGAGTSLKGKFKDPTTNAAVPGAQITLTSLADTSDVHKATAKDDGSFEITGLAVHSYKLVATRLGYAALTQIIRVSRKDQDAGVLAMTPESVPVSGITVTESPAPAIVKGDTTEYRASAVKVNKDATAEDLVQKLPGVTLENGQVKAHGENVQNVLVNGKPFFGSDPTAAIDAAAANPTGGGFFAGPAWCGCTATAIKAQRRGVEQVEPPARQHALPGAFPGRCFLAANNERGCSRFGGHRVAIARAACRFRTKRRGDDTSLDDR